MPHTGPLITFNESRYSTSNIFMSAQTFDAIVIGSGVSGGWAAKELTQRGLKVIMLERGRNIEHIKDYVTSTLNPWDTRYRGRKPKDSVAEEPEVKEALAKETKLFGVSARIPGSPYTEIKNFAWHRSYNVGGKSLSWGRQSYRYSDFDFDANAKKAGPLTGQSVIKTLHPGTTM
jgi:choline dehydrogenase-like flavoprotein